MEGKQPVRRNMLTATEVITEVFEGSISQYKLYDMVRRKAIPHSRVGSKIIFRRDVLEAWFQNQERENCRAK